MIDIIKLIDPVFIERNSQSSRDNVLTDVLDKIKYNRMAFFPEGTTGNGRALAKFKVGAFKPGIPIQPIIVEYNQYGRPDTTCWAWDGPSILYSFYLTMCRFSTGIKIVKLPVYYPSEEEQNDPELYASNMSNLLANHMKIPCLYYLFEDIRYMAHRYSIWQLSRHVLSHVSVCPQSIPKSCLS
jgi:1-acyl-sn-glycerol-3-phosphate acyltransferase